MDGLTLNIPFAVISAVILALITVLHILPLFLRARGSHALSFVCVGLHIPLMPMMLLAGFKLEHMILAYAVSGFVFTLVKFIGYELSLRKDRGEEGGSDR